jgi:Putative bacterial sensory transduction regulator
MLACLLATAPAAPAQNAQRPAPKSAMPVAAEPITQENLSKPLVKSVYKAALMDVKLDEDGDVMVRDTIRTWVFPNKDRIRLMAQYGFKMDAPLQQKLKLANRINDDYIIIRAIVTGKNQELLKLDYYLLVGSGMSKTNLVRATRRFMSIVPQAVKEHDTDDVMK